MFRKPKTLLLFALAGALFSLTPTASAADVSIAPKEAIAWIDVLLQRGIGQLGKLDLAKLRAQALNTRFEEAPISPHRPRTSGYYIFDRRIVSLNSNEFPRLESGLLGLLSLHEILGANGYADFHYQNTALIYAITRATPRVSGSLFAEMQSVAVFTESAYHSEFSAYFAGGDGVRGGGDATSIALKRTLIDGLYELERRGEVPTRSIVPTLVQIFDLRVERAEFAIPEGIRMGMAYDPEYHLLTRRTLFWANGALEKVEAMGSVALTREFLRVFSGENP